MNSPRNGIFLKKWATGLFFLSGFFAVSALSAEDRILPCQILLSEAEQKAQGFDRQRAMYPPDRAKRLAVMSLREGSDFLRQEKLAKAMEELNRAWRFDPSNPYSYWFAGIVRGMEAARLTEPDLRKRCFDDSLKLLAKAAAIIETSPNRELRENLALDRAETLIQYGLFLKKEHPEQAEQLFQQAEAILECIIPGRDVRGGQVTERIRDMHARMNAAREKSGTK